MSARRGPNFCGPEVSEFDDEYFGGGQFRDERGGTTPQNGLKALVLLADATSPHATEVAHDSQSP